jgi:hypothetical protein
MQNLLTNIPIMKKIYILCFSLFAINVIYGRVPTNGLVAYYPFSGDATDSSENSIDGVVNGATLTTDRFGDPDEAYSLNGVVNYINLGDMEKLSSNLECNSISSWIKSDTIGKSNYESLMKTINDGTNTLFSNEVHRGSGSGYEAGLITYQLRDESERVFTLSVKDPDVFDNNWNWHHILFVAISTSRNKGEV